MKNYKRLTERITASNTGRTVLVIPAFRHKIIQQTNRLAELEDKIESGELCDSKETAREIRDKIESKGRFEFCGYDGKEYLTISVDKFNQIINQYMNMDGNKE